MNKTASLHPALILAEFRPAGLFIFCQHSTLHAYSGRHAYLELKVLKKFDKICFILLNFLVFVYRY